MAGKLLPLFICLLLLGCAPTTAEPTETAQVTTMPLDQNRSENSPLQISPEQEGTFAQTNIGADGNRWVSGNVNLPDLSPLDIELSSQPEWVLGLFVGDGVLWTAVLEDGRVESFLVTDGTAVATKITPEQIPAGMPPLLALRNGQAEIVLPQSGFSPLTHPVIYNRSGDLAYIDNEGNLIVEQGDTVTSLPINAQLDGRILVDEHGRLLINTNPTNVYAHGIMGDDLEPSTLTLVATTPDAEVIRTIPIQDGWVMESIAPIWSDWNGDGSREIITTRANRQEGAQVVVMSEEGELLAAGPSIGQGNRWRHQLAIAPFSPDGTLELVEVRTPHIGGPTGFFRWNGEQLERATAASGYTTHVIFSRNLDMGIAGSFDGSGRLTLLAPNQARTELGGIQQNEDGAMIAWTLPLSGKLVTNISAVPEQDGKTAVAVGLDNNILRIWQD